MLLEESQPETPQSAIEKTPTHQPIENNEGVKYDGELENTLKNMENNNTGFCKTYHDPQRGWMLNNYPIKMLSGTEVKIINKENIITQGIQKVFTDTSYNTAKSMNDMKKLVFRDIFQKTDYYRRLPTKSRMSGCDGYIKKDLDKDVRSLLNLETEFNGKGFEKKLLYLLT